MYLEQHRGRPALLAPLVQEVRDEDPRAPLHTSHKANLLCMVEEEPLQTYGCIEANLGSLYMLEPELQHALCL